MKTIELVGKGHPDKVADQISDAVLDACLEQDRTARVACEVMFTKELVVVAGEITTTAKLNIPKIVHDQLAKAGYDGTRVGRDLTKIAVLNLLNKQSPNIATAVDAGGAGDQGIVFGYAEAGPHYLPAIMSGADAILHAPILQSPITGSDCKIQLTTDELLGEEMLVKLVVSVHCKKVNHDKIKQSILDYVKNDLPAQNLGFLYQPDFEFLFNPAGAFEVGGADADTGLTGRKIIADTYCGLAHHGGGAFSGKDLTKMDRAAAYQARFMASRVVEERLALKCEIKLAYAIGIDQPVDVEINTFGTGNPKKVSDFLKGFPIKASELGSTSTFNNYADLSAGNHFLNKNSPGELKN